MAATSFLKMFARSPIRPLQDHMSKVLSCAQGLQDFFDASFANNWDDAKIKHKAIAELEGEADKLKGKLRHNLPTGLFMPVARTDLLELLSFQDHIANTAKDISGVCLGRKMDFPELLKPAYSKLLTSSLKAVEQAQLAITELGEVIEAGFSGKEIKVVEKMIDALSKTEHQTDRLERDLRAQLFKIEDTLPPVHVMFLYRLIEWTGHLADQAEKVGGRLLILITK